MPDLKPKQTADEKTLTRIIDTVATVCGNSNSENV